jgi:S-adenosylmethionine decarboxylase proenzyme, Bacillus form
MAGELYKNKMEDLCMKKVMLALAFLGGMAQAYDFKGKHFFASYKECDEQALINIDALKEAFELAVNSSGATILKYDYVNFLGNGITATFILSESHASIHTYPEHNACFVDLFTCGDHCSWEKFDAILERYLKPGISWKEVKIRS